jgi:branched-chain amino acid transport system substrate-binding protein
LAVSALVVVLALVAAACGSSSKSGDAAGTTGTTATPATGTPLKIGWIGTITSASGVNTQGGKDTLDSWVKTTNAAGGISGHPVTAVYADDKGDPAVGLAAVKDLVENQHVIAIVGSYAGSTDQTWAPYVLSKQIPVVNGYAGDALGFTNPMFYIVAGSVIANTWGQMKSAAVAGAKKVSVVLCTEVAACAQAQPLFTKNAQSVGLDMVSNVLASSTQASYTAECLQAKNAGADAVAAFINLTVFARDCARQGFKPIYINADLLPSLATLKATPELTSIVGSSEGWPCFDQSVPGSSDMYAALKAYHPTWTKGGKDYALSTADICTAWAGGLAFKKAIENVAPAATATVTNADVIKGLSMFKNEMLGGVAPDVTFMDGTKPNAANPCIFLYQWNNQVFKATPGTDHLYTCQPAG